MSYEWKQVQVSGGTSTPVSNPAVGFGIYVNVSPTASLNVLDGSASNGYVIPAAAAVGNAYQFGGEKGVQFLTDINVTGGTGGEFTLLYNPLGEDHA